MVEEKSGFSWDDYKRVADGPLHQPGREDEARELFGRYKPEWRIVEVEHDRFSHYMVRAAHDGIEKQFGVSLSSQTVLWAD